jgi:hypothetical protein
MRVDIRAHWSNTTKEASPFTATRSCTDTCALFRKTIDSIPEKHTHKKNWTNDFSIMKMKQCDRFHTDKS